jgi:opacity protein-like surface antigen
MLKTKIHAPGGRSGRRFHHTTRCAGEQLHAACRAVAALVLLVLVLWPVESRAYDSDRFRPYIHFRSAEFNTAWGVLDAWGFGFGANFNQYLGAEFVIDSYEQDVQDPRFHGVGEQSALTLVPQLRLRYPLGNHRWVVYGVAGAGVAFLQFNDRKVPVYGLDIEADATRPVVAAGGGLEYFLADNVTFNLEGKYLWIPTMRVQIDGESRRHDMSAALFTMGLRAYFSKNHERPFFEEEDHVGTRLYFGARFGGSYLTDTRIAPGLKLDPEVSAWFSEINHGGGLTMGANFGRDWGVELAADFSEYTLNVDEFGPIGEYSVYTITPLLRLRVPLKGGRVVPYLMAGMGFTYAEFNDRKSAGAGLRIDADGIHPSISAGGGVEYFMARNFSLNADMRWNHTWNHRFRVNDRTYGRGDFSAVNLMLGMRLYLWEL